jgi:hypothetical protein
VRGGAPGKRTLEERLARKIESRLASLFVADECWIWTGAVTGSPRGGYGQIKIGGGSASPTLVHRLMYEREYGPIPEGERLDHRCEVKACVRPSHLRIATHAENLRSHYERFRAVA